MGRRWILAWAASFGANPAPALLLNGGWGRSAVVPWGWGTRRAVGLGYTPHHAWPAGWKERRTAGLVNPIKTFELEVCFAGNRHLSNLPSNLTFHSLLSSWDGRPKCRNHRGPVFFL